MTPGKRRYSLLPTEALGLVADVLTRAAVKHDPPGSIRPGYYERATGPYLDALYRHMEEYRAGNWIDPEYGLPHLAHVGANALILLALEIRDRS